jgi:hypothetical protein
VRLRVKLRVLSFMVVSIGLELRAHLCTPSPQPPAASAACRHVFGGIEARKHLASFQVRAQFLEIYNEDVKDLLVPPAEQATKVRLEARSWWGNRVGDVLQT